MTIKNFAGRALGVASLLFVAFAGGVSFQDFRSVRTADEFVSAAKLLPMRLETAYLTAAQAQTSPYTPYQTYADVLTTLRANYYGKDIDSTQMTYNGIRGMMGSLKDRYTRFVDPKAYKDMMDDNHGEFVGIGALLGTNKAEQIYVVRVLQGGPALRYKVMAGDIILKVDSKSTLKMKDTAVVKLIRGEAGTKVTLTLLRKDAPAPVVITMPRESVQQEVVQHSMIDPVNKIGYISLSVFNEESDVQVDSALLDLQSKGMKGLIFDLRENPGGLLDIAQRIASRFIPAGPVLWIKDRTGPMQSLDAIPSLHRNHLRFPLVVLVNGGSASAAEIVSGAIKDTGSGTLIGEKTFGKGLVQTVMPLHDRSGILITTQHYYTAMKNDINHKGIEPNITVKYTDDDQRKMYAYLREHPEATYDLQNDTQLQRALTEAIQRTRVASARPWE
ncbi:MAG: S41 family peptidase [Capsulimonas sp.]|jgi:carboxyl-terminal processing protease|uniref:S41 family peptidase n=1 Tax=Capsulimonas sp. TaxID=2494211 RepID=UPI0032661969